MIYIKIDNDVFYDDAVVLVRSFYPRTEVMALKADSKPEEKDEILSIEVPDVTGLDKKNAHEVFKDSLYKKLSEKTGKKLPWGYLTGVRPSKIAYTMLEEGATEEQIKKHFMDKHYASEEKADLALTVARKELDILTDMDYKTGYSLYIGIPFCPSICLYCSFSSYALGAYKDYVDNYVDALIKEIRFVAESMKGRRLDTVYMGGGGAGPLAGKAGLWQRDAYGRCRTGAGACGRHVPWVRLHRSRTGIRQSARLQCAAAHGGAVGPRTGDTAVPESTGPHSCKAASGGPAL